MPKPDEYEGVIPARSAARTPEKVARHSLAARMFHRVMAAAMFVLLFTAWKCCSSVWAG